jgi:hypothetical protein
MAKCQERRLLPLHNVIVYETKSANQCGSRF